MRRKKCLFLLILLMVWEYCPAQKALSPQALALEKDYYSMKEALKNPGKVYKLFLDYQTLMYMPQGIEKCINLQALSICGCSTKMNWDETFQTLSQFKNLQYLNLGQNELKSLSPQISKLKALKVINLGMKESVPNQLTTLPAEITKLKNLEEIYLEGNPFSEEEKKKWKEKMPHVKFYF